LLGYNKDKYRVVNIETKPSWSEMKIVPNNKNCLDEKRAK
jgi:hypothetical protein